MLIDKNTESETKAVRHYRGKAVSFGRFRGKREGKFWDAYNAATAVADTVPAARDMLRQDGFLTEAGQLDAMRKSHEGFFARRASIRRDVARERDKLRSEAAKLLEVEWDASSGVHDRLVQHWKSLDNVERARTLLPSEIKKHPELAKALLHEPALTSGVTDEQREALRNSLLTDIERAQLARIADSEHDLQTVERAYDAAAGIIREECQYDNDEFNMLLATQPAEPEPVKINTRRTVEGLGALMQQIEGAATDE